MCNCPAVKCDTALCCNDKQRQSLESLLPLPVRPLHGAELMEQLLAGEPGCHQILILGDEVINDLFLHTTGLEKNQELICIPFSHGKWALLTRLNKNVADPGYGDINRRRKICLNK